MKRLRLLPLTFMPFLALSFTDAGAGRSGVDEKVEDKSEDRMEVADSVRHSGDSVEPVELRALRELGEKCAAGDARALFRLAGLYDHGWNSVAKDSLKGDSLLRLSAAAKYPPAMNLLGFRLLNSVKKKENPKVTVDSALSLMEDAALSGDGNAAANLGFIFSRGDGVPADSLKALGWFRRAMTGGNVTAGPGLLELRKHFPSMPVDSATLGKAYLLSGYAFSRGEGGMPYSYKESLEMFRKGAEMGNEEARKIIGELIEQFPDALDFQ